MTSLIDAQTAGGIGYESLIKSEHLPTRKKHIIRGLHKVERQTEQQTGHLATLKKRIIRGLRKTAHQTARPLPINGHK